MNTDKTCVPCGNAACVQVQGMTELNGCEPIQIKVTGPYTMTIGDTTKLSAYKTGGYVKQVKVKQSVAFVSCSL